VSLLVEQLALQAKDSMPKNTLGVQEWIDTYNQRFAELIINECAKIADQERPNYLGCGYITLTVGERIQQHFRDSE
jgi:hypothetical protein